MTAALIVTATVFVLAAWVVMLLLVARELPSWGIGALAIAGVVLLLSAGAGVLELVLLLAGVR